jgi:hypothetical protein
MPISKVGSKGIKDAEISAADIAPGTVTNAKLASSSITLNGTAVSLGGTADIGTQWQSVITADGSTSTTAVAGEGYFIDNSSATHTINLPASPSIGDTVKIVALSGTTNAITVGRNGSNIQGAASDRVYQSDNQADTFTYSNATEGWTLETTTLEVPVYITASGGTETTSGNFKIHTFNSSSNFVVSNMGNQTTKASYLVVAGGGGGGLGKANNGGGGGGGAGGFRENREDIDSYSVSPRAASGGLTITTQTYPITVGAGGAGGSSPSTRGSSGSNSVFSTITSAGGGGGGSSDGTNGAASNGGSGGGAGSDGGPNAKGSGNTPPVSPSQGSDGGGPNSSGGHGSGGGGVLNAGATNVSPNGGGPGGGGATTSISASSTAYGGGGGGGVYHTNSCAAGTGGAGGGGNGTKGGVGAAATANTGGGGGGGGRSGPGNDHDGGAGGSGIVIVRYRYQ